MSQAFRARAPLALVLSGDEVAALGPLLDGGTLVLALEARASVTVRERPAGEWRSVVRGFGRSLLVNADLAAPADEGLLAVEAHGLREWRRSSVHEGTLEVVVEAPDAPDLGSLEARADALAACLDALQGASGSRALRGKRAAAARAGSPSGVLLGNVPRNRPSPEVARELEQRLLLLRDEHAPPSPCARLALLAWYSGDPAKREALERAARVSRAVAEVAWGERLASLPGLLREEVLALEPIAPRSSREKLLDESLIAAGAHVVRRLGDRGLLAVLAPDPQRRESLVARAAELNLSVLSSRLGAPEIEIEAVNA